MIRVKLFIHFCIFTIFAFLYSSPTYVLYSFDVFQVKMKETNIFPILYRR